MFLCGVSAFDPKRTLFALTAEAEAKRPAGAPYSAGAFCTQENSASASGGRPFLWVVVVALQAPWRSQVNKQGPIKRCSNGILHEGRNAQHARRLSMPDEGTGFPIITEIGNETDTHSHVCRHHPDLANCLACSGGGNDSTRR